MSRAIYLFWLGLLGGLLPVALLLLFVFDVIPKILPNDYDLVLFYLVGFILSFTGFFLSLRQLYSENPASSLASIILSMVAVIMVGFAAEFVFSQILMLGSLSSFFAILVFGFGGRHIATKFKGLESQKDLLSALYICLFFTMLNSLILSLLFFAGLGVIA